MFYSFPLTVPANTLESAPTTLACKLTSGTIERVDVQFPPGCAGLVHVALTHALHQLWPSNPDGSFAADGYVISFNEDLPFKTAPYVLTLTGWSDDDTYGHTVTVRIGVRRAGGVPDWMKTLLGVE